ncbi:MAG: DUF1294 domain-containing protein [Desulfococcaceae bacterium]
MNPTAIQIALAVLALCNLSCFIAYYIDKFRARRDRDRISEARLLQISFIGPLGSIPGIWGLRHKNRKGSYLMKYGIVMALSLAGHLLAGYFTFSRP